MKKRNINLDLIRMIAVFSVLAVHFFLNSNYYSTLLEGGTMYVATLVGSSKFSGVSQTLVGSVSRV